MTIPTHIEFQEDLKQILLYSLLAVSPEEGCALLLGKSLKIRHNQKANIYQVQLIWPCCNVWEDKINNNFESTFLYEEMRQKTLSKKNRFALDPREQLFAQKWARSKRLKVLGTAHSHPINSTIPSKIDISCIFSPNLMIIVNGENEMSGWWVKSPQDSNPKQIPLLNKN
ncbi:M67 family metallopeptidase [Prochlorococcus marinus]|uniref:M67 family metallopeptidase n=1 Tax=Prochlorococcus marinus TaxID=1219 RepID=UPI0022B3FD35|nr:M67 family metallopeptidase [Prochlorococcus marinus]